MVGNQSSQRHLAEETGVSLGSASTAMSLIKFFPYQIMYVNELKNSD
jgi:hypothetical protein